MKKRIDSLSFISKALSSKKFSIDNCILWYLGIWNGL